MVEVKDEAKVWEAANEATLETISSIMTANINILRFE